MPSRISSFSSCISCAYGFGWSSRSPNLHPALLLYASPVPSTPYDSTCARSMSFAVLRMNQHEQYHSFSFFSFLVLFSASSVVDSMFSNGLKSLSWILVHNEPFRVPYFGSWLRIISITFIISASFSNLSLSHRKRHYVSCCPSSSDDSSYSSSSRSMPISRARAISCRSFRFSNLFR